FGILLYLDYKIALAVLGIVIFFILVAELLSGRKLGKRFALAAISNQIFGRVLGELAALIWIYSVNPNIFLISFLPILLIVFAHKDRLQEQFQKIKDKTYLTN
ncbi:MAG: hypothetical protein PHG23_03480, partial [Candidatus Pacebacteria bacterium]|nr:hypothetical protein [Candidatus Paceibacterota bacterium]